MIAIECDAAGQRVVGLLAFGLRDEWIVRLGSRDRLIGTARLGHHEEALFGPFLKADSAELGTVVHQPFGGVVVGEQRAAHGEIVMDGVQIAADTAVLIAADTAGDRALLNLLGQQFP